MDTRILEEIGLSPNEAKIYETLVNTGAVSINALSVESDVHRRNVYDSLEKLIKKGLVSEEFISGTRHVKAVNPSRLLDLVREKEAKVNSIIPELQERFNAKAGQENAVLYRGIEGFKNYLNDILEVGETFYSWGAKGFWLDERLRYFVPKFEQERLRKKIRMKHIFDYEVRGLAPDILKMRLNEYKFLPKECSSKMSIDFFGDHIVMFHGIGPGHLTREPMQFKIVSKELADGYRKYFEFMWKNLGKSVKVD